MAIPLKVGQKRTSKVAMLTGLTGQDGSYLTDLLIEKGYSVVGIKRRSSTNNLERVQQHLDNEHLIIVEGDITDAHSMSGLISKYKPDEFYNLAAQSHVGTSFEQPYYTFEADAVGVLHILEAIRRYSPETRFYQASTSEMFGSNISFDYDVQGQAARYDGLLDNTSSLYHNRYGRPACTPINDSDGVFQDEETPFSPNSPYAVAKVAAHNLVGLYRDAYNVHGSCGILFNHESERRGENFVTRKITKWIGDFMRWRDDHPQIFEHAQLTAWQNMDTENYIYQGLAGSPKFPRLRLGNLDAYRDWGHAKDYVEGMWLMLQQDEPDDYVLATGETHSVREFLDVAFKLVKIDNWEDLVVIDPKFYRPAEVDYLLGNPSKAKEKLGWEPRICFNHLVYRMIQHDLPQHFKMVDSFNERYLKCQTT